MTSTYLDTLTELQDDLQANVTGLTNATLYQTQPLWFPPQEPSLACWFDFEEVIDEGPTGARHFQEYYWLKYWESAPFDESMVAPDPDEIETLRLLYEEVRARFMRVDTQSFGDASPLWFIRGRLGLGEANEDAYVRGFEIYFWARRFRSFE